MSYYEFINNYDMKSTANTIDTSNDNKYEYVDL